MTRAIVAAVAIGLFVTPGPAADGVTIDDRSPEAFGRPVPALPRAELRRFAFGNRLFKASWTVAPASVPSLDGLGPLYNRASCSGCHVRDGRGRLPESPDEPLRSALVRVVTTDDTPHPRYGHQLLSLIHI